VEETELTREDKLAYMWIALGVLFLVLFVVIGVAVA